MTVIGDAYVEVKAKTDGFESGAEGLFGSFGAKAAVAFAAGFAAVGAVTKVLYDIGASFDSAFDTIRVGTGKTGPALKSLEDSFKHVATTGPESFDKVSATITTLSQKLGLSGKPLEAFSRQLLDLSHITGTDVGANVKAVTDVLNNFGVSAKDQGAKLDELFRATQQSGLGITDLATQMASTGVQMRAVGLTFEDSTAIIAGLAKEGLSASDVLPALNKTLAVAAKSGKDAGTAFRDTIASIKDAPTATAAAGIALQAFGARGAKMAELIREGKLSFDGLKMSIVGGSDTISKATKDTADFSEKLDTFKNKVLVGLEPLASSVFDAFSRGIDAVAPALEDFAGKAEQVFNIIFHGDFTHGPFSEDSPFVATLFSLREKYLPGLVAAFDAVTGAVSTVVAFVSDNLQPILIALGAAFLLAAGPVVGLAAAFVYAYTQFDGFRETVGKIVDWITGTVAPAVGAFASSVAASFGDLVKWTQQHWAAIREAISHVVTVIEDIVRGVIAAVSFAWDHWGDDMMHMVEAAWSFIRGTIQNGVKFIQGLIDTVLAVINGDWGKAWDGIKQMLAAVWDQLGNIVKSGIEGLKAAIGGVLSALSAIWSGVWTGIKMLAIAGWNAMVDWLTGGGLLGLASFFLGLPGKILGFLGDLSGKLVSAGIDLMKGLAKGLLDGAKDAVKSTLGHITDLIPDWKGPMAKDKALLAPTGKAIIQGLLDGMKGAAPAVQQWLAALTNNIVSGAGVVVAGIRAQLGLGDAKGSVADATQARNDLLSRQSVLPALIQNAMAEVAKQAAAARAVTPDEQLAIDRAQQAVVDKTKALTDAQADGKHSALELRIMSEELAAAQRDVTAAQKDAVAPTDALAAAEQKLSDLRDEQRGMAKALETANRNLADAELAVVDAQGQLVTSQAALAQGGLQGIAYFQQLAQAAGLTSGAIQQLIGDLTAAQAMVAGPRPGAVPGAGSGPNTRPIPPGGKQPTTPGWDLAAGTGPDGITFTPGGGGMSLADIQKIVAGLGATPHTTTVVPLTFASIDTKGLLERMNVKAAVGEAVTSATRLRPIAT